MGFCFTVPLSLISWKPWFYLSLSSPHIPALIFQSPCLVPVSEQTDAILRTDHCKLGKAAFFDKVKDVIVTSIEILNASNQIWAFIFMLTYLGHQAHKRKTCKFCGIKKSCFRNITISICLLKSPTALCQGH